MSPSLGAPEALHREHRVSACVVEPNRTVPYHGGVPNNLYYCRIKVLRSPDAQDIPESVAGAYVPSFAAAEDHQKALGLLIPTLVEHGWVFQEILNHRIDEMEPEHWDAFIEATWPDIKADLPDQETILQMIETGGVFYGPFAVWNASPNEG